MESQSNKKEKDTTRKYRPIYFELLSDSEKNEINKKINQSPQCQNHRQPKLLE